MSRRLSKTEAALDIMGKAHALLENLRERGHRQPPSRSDGRKPTDAEAGDIPTRQAAALTGMVARRRPGGAPPPRRPRPQRRRCRPAVEPVNKLSDPERAHGSWRC